jgi:ATP-binding cassette subfamily B protein
VIGFVTQETYLFHTTIRANLLYARPNATDEELEAATGLPRSMNGSWS